MKNQVNTVIIGSGICGLSAAHFLAKKTSDFLVFEATNTPGGIIKTKIENNFICKIDSIEVCGKTGTVENKTFNDHSVFISFAPMNNPAIAIAVYVEYGTWGSKWAAPIASLMMERYIKGSLSEKSIKKANKISEAVILNQNTQF